MTRPVARQDGRIFRFRGSVDWSKLILLAGLLVVAAPRPGAPQDRRDPIAIKGATVIDGTGASPWSDATILIEDGRIGAIGPNVEIPPGVRTIPARGRWI